MVLRSKPKNSEPARPIKFQHPKIEEWSLDKLRPAKRNARTHSKKQAEKLVAIIRQFGFINPIIIADDGTIIAGHLRYQVAKLLRMAAVPVISISHLSDIEKRAFALAENRIAQDAGTDRAILARELADLQIELPKENIEIGVTAYDAVEVDQILSDFDEPANESEADQLPPGGPSVTYLGDLWLLGGHRLICADAREPTAFARLLGNQLAAMVITDPPFNVSVRSHARGRSRTRFSEFPIASGELTTPEYQSFLDRIAALIAGRCNDGAIIMMFIDWPHVGQMLAAGAQARLELKNLCVWVKSNFGQGAFYRSEHELVCVFKHGTAPHINTFELGQHGRTRTNVWRYAGVNAFKAGRHDELNMHPTVKPVRLVVDAMLDCSKRNSIILDPFMGSGTSIIAGETIGRRVYGMELDPRYVDVAVRRWQKFTGRDAVLERTGQTFGEVESERAGVPLERSRSPAQARGH